jgi:hypothetical protein
LQPFLAAFASGLGWPQLCFREELGLKNGVVFFLGEHPAAGYAHLCSKKKSAYLVSKSAMYQKYT